MIGNRKLGCLEQAMEKLNSRAKTWNIVTISRIKGTLNETILRQALDTIQSRHPRLNSRIIRFQNSLYFQTEGTTKIPLRVVKKFDEQHWQDVAQEEMNQAIDSNQCLMRCVLVHIQRTPCCRRWIIIYSTTFRNFDLLSANCFWKFN
jgi:hypothetical protein